jgi:hypothetical protein
MFSVEPAKSGRATCKGCMQKIAKDTLRVGKEYDTGQYQGVAWKHLTCTDMVSVHDSLSSAPSHIALQRPSSPKTIC